MTQTTAENSFGVIMTNALDAAKNVHIIMCNADAETKRKALSDAMHSLLIIAEQCRQEFAGTAPADEITPLTNPIIIS